MRKLGIQEANRNTSDHLNGGTESTVHDEEVT